MKMCGLLNCYWWVMIGHNGTSSRFNDCVFYANNMFWGGIPCHFLDDGWPGEGRARVTAPWNGHIVKAVLENNRSTWWFLTLCFGP